eukprot:CAMPEP_0197408926 /NCGR_PEP_ID=MMETSP1165-20131217/29150_1 /TAXON_ID=284809 /ORGANISM="Chrysocystis fragilis, Strain CCMP3189" /LENGTH=226 /DNA_ID=CAMNT_0042935369 /DNA_START=12 /DNA_END=692 /DNA_ORIENTATION=+
MAQRSPAVEAILKSAEQFNESSIELLEENVRAQVAAGTYDFEANKALVKLYQISPWRCEAQVLALVLVKAMMARPAEDLTALRLMCPEALLESTPLLRRIGKCESMLESARFGEFWELARDEVVDLVPGFADSLRHFILRLLADTFATVSVDLVAAALGVQASDVRRLAADTPPDSLLAPSPDPNLVRFKPNAHNQPRLQRFAAPVQLDALLALYDSDPRPVLASE